MNMTNATKVIAMMADLSSTIRNNNSASVKNEINNRILELAKALKFKEEDLECFLSDGSKAATPSKVTKKAYIQDI